MKQYKLSIVKEYMLPILVNPNNSASYIGDQFDFAIALSWCEINNLTYK